MVLRSRVTRSGFFTSCQHMVSSQKYVTKLMYTLRVCTSAVELEKKITLGIPLVWTQTNINHFSTSCTIIENRTTIEVVYTTLNFKHLTVDLWTSLGQIWNHAMGPKCILVTQTTHYQTQRMIRPPLLQICTNLIGTNPWQTKVWAHLYGHITKISQFPEKIFTVYCWHYAQLMVSSGIYVHGSK